jgi:iron complex outermembrane receptor protein
MQKILTILFSFGLGLSLNAQIGKVKGTVVDNEGRAVIGANVSASPGNAGTITDLSGEYMLNLDPGTYTITASFIGFASQTFEISLKAGETKNWDVALAEGGILLEDVVLTGTRSAPRSNTTSPLPIDVFTAKDLLSTGQNSFDKSLQYRVPSFNTVQTPVNDATALLDPYEIRNMGPSRTLILINGKRKNMSSLLYVQTSPGRGETGADISAIPTDMIKRIEILRDGASAQYGSDAIAGVMNIILKDDAEHGGVTFRSGVTSKGDGEMFGVALNNGTKLGSKGFMNYTIDLSKIGLANRPGTVDAAGEAADFGASLSTVQAFLKDYPDAGNINGSPETTAAKFALNFGSQISDNTELYGNAAYVYKKVNSFANYRTPYWRTLSDFPYLTSFFGLDTNNDGIRDKYVGYVPTFDGDLSDYNATLGWKTNRNGWTADVSFTTGGNEQTYTVRNSHNRNGTQNPDGTNKYQENSPVLFKPGGTSFNHNVGNIDISKRLTDKVGIAFGSEFRSENFNIIEGDLASYEDGGADSFAGNDPRNSGKFNRYNFGGYADIALDFTDDFLVNGTARLENYSDFGSAFVWKMSTRYKFNEDKVTLRGSLSTGFKAPTLHQIYTQKAQYSFVPGQGIQVGGLISNVSREARLLGLPSLEPEKSNNFTIGAGFRPNSNLSFTIDYYNIAVKDRIILSTEISSTGKNTPLDKILADNNLSDLSFFVNGLNTKTSGIDVVGNYRGLTLGDGSLGINLSGNITLVNERDGAVNNPKLVKDAGQSVANQTQEALFFTSRPKFKGILGLDYEVGKFTFSLNNTLFGPTTFRQQGLDPGIYTEFKTKMVTDLGITLQTTKNSTLSVNINNILNVLPEWSFKADAGKESKLNDAAYLKNQSNLITFNQRYSQMTYDGFHFSQLGTIFNAALNIRF